MNHSLIIKDIKRNKAIHLILVLFISFSVCLAYVSAYWGISSVTSILALYEHAKPPHFFANAYG